MGDVNTISLFFIFEILIKFLKSDGGGRDSSCKSTEAQKSVFEEKYQLWNINRFYPYLKKPGMRAEKEQSLRKAVFSPSYKLQIVYVWDIHEKLAIY